MVRVVMTVMKFGGSSLADPARIRRVADIGVSRDDVLAVVLSAMKGVTDTLLEAADRAEKGDRSYREILDELRNRHRQAAEELVDDPARRTAVATEVENLLDELGDILHGVELVRECSPRTRDLVSGFGERLSCRIVAAHITDRGVPALPLDARDFIRTDDAHGRAAVDFHVTGEKTRACFAGLEGLAVVTGFIASTEDGVATTLGRNGSDYTASILAAALGATSVEIWTDVDGVLTADPRVVPEAWVIEEISFQEAMELSYFGAEVIHPYTLVPVIEKGIPVRIKNTLNPDAPGTIISGETKPKKRPITGIASIDDVAMVTIEGGGMVGMPGIAGRIFSAVARAGVNIIMISQASSEHSICLVCKRNEAEYAARVLENDLSDALSSRLIRRIDVVGGLEIVAVIGENMRGQVGLSGKLFSALGEAGVNILAIAQGSSELNISFVIDGRTKTDALRAIHRAFIG